MIKIDKKMINNMVEVYKLEKYLNIIVDYKKEDELTRKKRNLVTQFSNFYNTNTIDTLIQVVNEIDNINNIEQLYIYEPDEVMSIFFYNNSTFKNNMWLSTARPTQVFEYFTEQKHLDPKTLETTGRSQYDPVADNKTEKGRARNRRVEIKIYTEE